jgi:hypothetical protein
MGVLDEINGRWERGTLQHSFDAAGPGLGHVPRADESKLYHVPRSALDLQSELSR